MGKVKSAIITTLLIVAIAVLTVFATVSFPMGVENFNSMLTSIHLGSDLTGDAYVMLYPEGVISSEEYNAEYNGKESEEDKQEYVGKYEAKGGVYVEKEELLSVGEEKFLENVASDAKILSNRFGKRGYTSYSVSVVDGYAIKVSVPTGFTYAAYKGNHEEARSTALSEISTTVSYLTISGGLSLRHATEGSSWDQNAFDNLNLLTAAQQEQIGTYFKSISDYGVAQGYAVRFKLTSEGRDLLAKKTELVAAAEDTNLLFYVGENQIISLTCDGVLGEKQFYISVANQAVALDYSILFDSVINGEILSNVYEYDEVKVATSAMGENSALFVAIAIAVIMLAAIVVSIVKYKKLGIVNALMLLVYALTVIIALNVTGVIVTVAGIVCAVLGLLLLCGINFYVFEEVRKQTKTGKTIKSSISSAYKNTWKSLLDMHVVALVFALVLALIGVGEVSACGVILMFAVLASYAIYWFTRFVWYVISGPAKDKFAFGGFKREVYEDD